MRAVGHCKHRSRSAALIGGNVASSFGLNYLAQLLSYLMGGDLDLIKMRRPRPLLAGLNLASHLGCLFKNFGKFFFENFLFRVHAILPEV